MKGILGRKLGMTQVFTAEGNLIPVTVVECEPNVVLQKKTVETDGYDAIQLGIEDIKESRATKPELGHAKKANTAAKKFIKEIVALLGLEKKLYNMPTTLSGGQQQRVAIARALASKPAIILADEPTGNLDSKTSDEVIELLKVTSQKFHQTIVMITHNPEIAAQADRTIHIEDGRIAE